MGCIWNEMNDSIYQICVICWRVFVLLFVCFVFFFSCRRRHTRCSGVSWARRCVREARGNTEARGAGLGGIEKGGAAEGATRRNTKAEGAGLDGIVKGGAAVASYTHLTLPTIYPVLTLVVLAS